MLLNSSMPQAEGIPSPGGVMPEEGVEEEPDDDPKQTTISELMGDS